MASRHDRRLMLLLGLVAVVAACALTVTGLGTGMLFLAPALMLALPLLAGRYVGEERVIALRGVLRVRARRPLAQALSRLQRAPRAIVARGGRLIAVGLAERGPPVAAAR